MTSGPPAGGGERGNGFTLVEVLLALAIMALLGTLLLPGVNSIMRSLATSEPDQLVWATLNQVREQALTGNRPIWLQSGKDNTRLSWSDGQGNWTKELPAGCRVQRLFLRFLKPAKSINTSRPRLPRVLRRRASKLCPLAVRRTSM